MRSFLRLLALTLVSLFAFSQSEAQTVTVTANLKTMFANNLSAQGKVCFSLIDGAGQQLVDPRVTGGVIVPTANQCVLPDNTGHISTTIYANDQINPLGSHYSVQYLFNNAQVHGDTFTFLLADGTENLNTKLPDTTFPITPAPTGDTTYGRLDGGNFPFLAPINAPGYQIGGVAGSGNYLKGNGISFISSSGPAAGVGSCTNQVVIATNSDTAPTCSQVVSADLASSLTLVTPNIGAATGTSLTATGQLQSNQGGGGAGSGIYVNASNPSYGWNQTGVAVDNRLWDAVVDGTAALRFRMLNDAQSSSIDWMKISRSGVSATNVDFSGAAKVSGTQFVAGIGSNSAPSFNFSNSSNTGLYSSGPGNFFESISGVDLDAVAANLRRQASGLLLGWTPTTVSGVLSDVNISRASAGVLQIGTGETANTLGGFRAATINNIKWASNFNGGDCGAKVNAASSAFAGAPGEIWVDQLCGNFTTQVITGVRQFVRFIQPGTYTYAGASWNTGQGGGIVGPGCGGNLCGVVLQAANAQNGNLILPSDQNYIGGFAMDGNKTNNPNGHCAIATNLHQQIRINNVLIQNFKACGIDVRSSTLGDESTVPVIENSLIIFNDGPGINCLNTTDGFISKGQLEQNGLGALGATATIVNVSGTSVTWVSGPQWSTAGELVGTFIKFGNSSTTNFIVATIPSNTSLTLTASAGTQTGTAVLWGSGVDAQDCPGWRYEHSDFGGNGNDGIFLHGSGSGRGSGQNMIVGNEWGSNHAHDLEIQGFTGTYVAADNTIMGNVFLGSTISPANTFSDIFVVDGSQDTIMGNVFRPANRKFGVDFEESASGRMQNEGLVGNSFIPGFGTAAFSANTNLATNSLKIFANIEGTSGTTTFGMGPGSMKIQGGIVNSGTGHMHIRVTSCTTTAVLNGSCTSTITWPGTWNDTSYTASCNLIAPTAAAGVGWLGSKTTTTQQVQIINLAGSASAASGEIDCIADHD